MKQRLFVHGRSLTAQLSKWFSTAAVSEPQPNINWSLKCLTNNTRNLTHPHSKVERMTQSGPGAPTGPHTDNALRSRSSLTAIDRHVTWVIFSGSGASSHINLGRWQRRSRRVLPHSLSKTQAPS